MLVVNILLVTLVTSSEISVSSLTGLFDASTGLFDASTGLFDASTGLFYTSVLLGDDDSVFVFKLTLLSDIVYTIIHYFFYDKINNMRWA